MSIVNKLGNFYWNIKSKKTTHKLLVIESDDWGSLRTEKKEDLLILNKINSKIKSDPYIQLDGIANTEDLEALFDTLSKVRDSNLKNAVLTANVCMANPDFDKIKESQFNNFYFEPFYQTIKKSNGGDEILSLWGKGIEENLFHPQLHGREHLHALAWLDELNEGNEDLLKAFDLKVWGIPYKSALNKQRRHNFQAALDIYDLKNEEEFQLKWLKESALMFEDYFGFKSKTFIPPAYIWHTRIHEHLKECGIKSLQGIKLQYEPKEVEYKKIIHFMGEYNAKDNIAFFPRNVFFEPSLSPNKDWINETLGSIDTAFANNQPAIIGSHRINYIGKLSEKNRNENLKMLTTILKKAVAKHPDIIFVSSDELINYF